MTHHLASTFDEMAEMIAVEDPSALVLSWWCRVEKALAYYTTAYHGTRMRNDATALRALESDGRVEPATIKRLHILRRRRNAIAHGEVVSVSPREAKEFAYEAWDLGWLVGSAVPDELAISSRAALAC